MGTLAQMTSDGRASARTKTLTMWSGQSPSRRAVVDFDASHQFVVLQERVEGCAMRADPCRTRSVLRHLRARDAQGVKKRLQAVVDVPLPAQPRSAGGVGIAGTS